MNEINQLEGMLEANEVLLEKAVAAKDTEMIFNLLTHRNLIKSILLDLYRQQKAA